MNHTLKPVPGKGAMSGDNGPRKACPTSEDNGKRPVASEGRCYMHCTSAFSVTNRSPH